MIEAMSLPWSARIYNAACSLMSTARQSGPRLVAAALALLIAIEIVVIWNGQRSMSFTPSSIPIPVRPGVATDMLGMARAIVSANLFGTAPQPDQQVYQSQSEFVLSGTIARTDSPDGGYAIISSPGAPARVYMTGQALGDGLILKEVRNKYVVLDRNGASEALVITNAAPLQAAGTVPTFPPRPLVAAPVYEPPPTPPIPGLPVETPQSSPQAMARYEEQLKNIDATGIASLPANLQ